MIGPFGYAALTIAIFAETAGIPAHREALMSLADGRQPAWTFEHDEGIRGDTAIERLAKLPPQPGTEGMTAGNSSQLSDGASAVVLAAELAEGDARYGCLGICVGSGQGVAIVLERV